MSNLGLIIEERSRDIGDFLVGRLLPFRKKRMVGPFIFVDHMGPSEIGPEHYLDIGQHPHIGLSTLTYLFEGEAIHRDTTGARQRIRPGAVNWMSAGKGVVHTERTPEDWRDAKVRRMHGFQIWVAHPKEQESADPSFFHADADQLPFWQENGLEIRLIAGSAFGHRSPVPVYSPLFMLEAKATEDTRFSAGKGLKGEIGICVVEGSLQACGECIGKGKLLIAKEQDHCEFEVAAGSHLLIFGGEPLPEKRYIWWNFVTSDPAIIEAAKEKWANKQFPMLSDDNSYIPLPQR